jgi:hypothetical protein
VGVDLLRQQLRTLTVQPRRQLFPRNLTPHPCIVAHHRAARKDHLRDAQIVHTNEGN